MRRAESQPSRPRGDGRPARRRARAVSRIGLGPRREAPDDPRRARPAPPSPATPAARPRPPAPAPAPGRSTCPRPAPGAIDGLHLRRLRWWHAHRTQGSCARASSRPVRPAATTRRPHPTPPNARRVAGPATARSASSPGRELAERARAPAQVHDRASPRAARPRDRSAAGRAARRFRVQCHRSLHGSETTVKPS